MQGMEYEQQVIGTYCRMLREQGEESENASCHSGAEKQEQVESPKGFPSSYAVYGGGCHKDEEQ